MSLQVKEFKHTEGNSRAVVEVVGSPGGWRVVGVQEEVHRQESKEAEVMEAILEHVGEGHGST